MTRDPALAEALDRAAAVTGRRTPAATLVHDLAIRGAEALVADHRADGRAIERRVERSASDDPGCDLAVLADVDRLGWGQP